MPRISALRTALQTLGVSRVQPSPRLQGGPSPLGEAAEGIKMAEIVRCPYCVQDEHFKPMLRRPDGLFVCNKCGHTAMPVKPEFKCFCQKCGELNRVA
jgi:hypothetical protein